MSKSVKKGRNILRDLRAGELVVFDENNGAPSAIAIVKGSINGLIVIEILDRNERFNRVEKYKCETHVQNLYELVS